MTMPLDHQLSERLEQRTALSQQQRRSLELLQMPLAELDVLLTQELASNPLLDAVPDVSDAPEKKEAADEAETEDESRFSAENDEAGAGADDWPETPGGISGDDPDRFDPLANSPAPPPDPIEFLLEEVNSASLPPQLIAPVLEIVGALDERGYLAVPLADLAMGCDADLGTMEEALKIVQNFDPAGIAARNLAECLKLQLERSGRLTPEIAGLLDHGMEDLENNRLAALTRKLQITPEKLKELLAVLRTLDPAPLHGEKRLAENFIRPELEIVRGTDGTFQAVQLYENSRRLIVSPVYEKMASRSDLSSEDRRYLNEKLNRAKELIHSLELRDSTLLRLGKVIVETQQDFLERGVEWLRPLTMKQAGEKLSLTESTVSRAAADKYVRTPHGLFPLRFFFSGGYADASGEEVATRSVMEKIRKMIEDEDPRQPLSDERISQMLEKGGLKVARRTVAKYREALKIPSSALRKEIF